MRKFLITGTAGFIGYHTARRLLSAGHQVLGIDSMSSYYDPRLKRDRVELLETHAEFTQLEMRLEDGQELAAVVADFSPDVVIHLAAQAGVRYSIENPEAYLSANVLGTHSLLTAVRDLPVEHILVASTSSVYGGNEKMPFAETDGTRSPVSLYAATKVATEALSHAHANIYRQPITAFRFFTVYGPWGRPDMALYKFVQAIGSGAPIDVYGEGKMRRDFTYIDDLVSCIERLVDAVPAVGRPVGQVDSLSPVAPYRVVNIGGGAPVELVDFIDAIEIAMEKRADRRLLPMQPGDVVSTFADTTLLSDLIGAVPSTGVQVGVDRFVEWYRSYYSNAVDARTVAS